MTTKLPKLTHFLGLCAALLLGVALANAPKPGGVAVIALIQEPGQLNQFFNNQSGSQMSLFAVEPLFVPKANGEYEPRLAAEVPTLKNGGLSEDFLSVTYRLRDGITWSDGEPFTAEDVVFTWEVYSNPESTVAGRVVGPSYSLIDSVTMIDPLTVEVKMNSINPGYLDLWQAVLPAHKFESSAVTIEHPQARIPLGTGPFIIEEWRTGDRIRFVRNSNYREAGKPYLDEIVVKVIPDKNVAITSLVEGDVDSVFFIVTGDLPTLTRAQDAGKGVVVGLQGNPSWVEWLWLNQSDPKNFDRPHPVLGDPAIREAMDYGIDRQAVIDGVLEGFGYTVGSFIYSGWAAADIAPTPYDPEEAALILDEAGWVMGPDGVRSKDGVRASVLYQTIAGDLTRELYQQVVQQNLADIGIELKIQNVPSNTIFGSWSEGGIYKRGQFDILMSRAGYVIDPVDWTTQFTAEQIPSEENQAGLNRVRYSNPEFDELVAQASQTLDQDVRKDLYRQAAEIFAEDRPSLPLYSSAWGWAWRERLKGVDIDFWSGMWHSSADWYIEEQ
jgi:peptide/nickel transport system substrate-binding protein